MSISTINSPLPIQPWANLEVNSINAVTVTATNISGEVYHDSMFLQVTSGVGITGTTGGTSITLGITESPTPGTNLTYIDNTDASFSFASGPSIVFNNTGKYDIKLCLGDINVTSNASGCNLVISMQYSNGVSTILTTKGNLFWPAPQGATGDSGSLGNQSICIADTLKLAAGDSLIINATFTSLSGTANVVLGAGNSGSNLGNFISIVAL